MGTMLHSRCLLHMARLSHVLVPKGISCCCAHACRLPAGGQHATGASLARQSTDAAGQGGAGQDRNRRLPPDEGGRADGGRHKGEFW